MRPLATLAALTLAATLTSCTSPEPSSTASATTPTMASAAPSAPPTLARVRLPDIDTKLKPAGLGTWNNPYEDENCQSVDAYPRPADRGESGYWMVQVCTYPDEARAYTAAFDSAQGLGHSTYLLPDRRTAVLAGAVADIEKVARILDPKGEGEEVKYDPAATEGDPTEW